MNNTKLEWQWNEFAGIGGKHNDAATAERYDEFHKGFRDIDADNDATLALLNPQPHQTLMDLGAGTGLFTLAAAKRYTKVYAVDIAEPMLAKAKEKAQKTGLTNIEYRQGGFLTYEHQGDPVDVVVSQMAMHHLPDVWKFISLARIASLLKPGGTLYLEDTVFSGMTTNYVAFLETLCSTFTEEQRKSVHAHIRDEYTTIDWIMEGCLTRAGFSIQKVQHRSNFLAMYLCRKESKP